MEIPLAMQGLDSEDLRLVHEVFSSGQHTMGAKVKKFEEEFAEFVGTKYSVMVNSGSSANLLAMEVATRGQTNKLGKSQGKMIAIPAVLWPTSLWPIIQLGYKVLVIDTLPDSLMIDLEKLRKAKKEFGNSLVGAVVIHPLGKALDLVEIEKLRTELELFIIEDTCESLGSGNNNVRSGSAGNFGTFSFYFSHHITTVEGGMVVTNDLKDYDDLISMRAHGWTRNRSDKLTIEIENPLLHEDFLFLTSGYNFRPMEFQGVLGSSQLKKFPNFLLKRISNATRVAKELTDSEFEILDFHTNDYEKLEPGIPNHSSMALPIKHKHPDGNIKKVMDYLSSKEIANRPLLAGNILHQPAFKHANVKIYENLRNSSYLYDHSFMLGNHHNYSDEQINKVIKVLKNYKSL